MLDTHYGKRSWWDGRIKTLCGRTLPDCEWTPAAATCAECRRLHAAGKRP